MPVIIDKKNAGPEVKLMFFLRGAIVSFTEGTPMTPEQIGWALAYLTGSAIGQPRSLQNTPATLKQLRDEAVRYLDNGIDAAQRGQTGSGIISLN